MSARYSINKPTDGAGGSANNMAVKGQRFGTGHPAVTYLIILILLEYAAYLTLRYAFRSVHGG